MTVPYYTSVTTRSDMRGIKPGWYAIEDDGNLSSGLFRASGTASRESRSRRSGRWPQATTWAGLNHFPIKTGRRGRRQKDLIKTVL